MLWKVNELPIVLNLMMATDSLSFKHGFSLEKLTRQKNWGSCRYWQPSICDALLKYNKENGNTSVHIYIMRDNNDLYRMIITY